jgi:hypothetical protein
MTPTDWAQLALAVTALFGTVATGVRWLVKHYLAELKPNGGSSMRDTVNRLEAQVEIIIKMLTKENK